MQNYRAWCLVFIVLAVLEINLVIENVAVFYVFHKPLFMLLAIINAPVALMCVIMAALIYWIKI